MIIIIIASKRGSRICFCYVFLLVNGIPFFVTAQVILFAFWLEINFLIQWYTDNVSYFSFKFFKDQLERAVHLVSSRWLHKQRNCESVLYMKWVFWCTRTLYSKGNILSNGFKVQAIITADVLTQVHYVWERRLDAFSIKQWSNTFFGTLSTVKTWTKALRVGLGNVELMLLKDMIQLLGNCRQMFKTRKGLVRLKFRDPGKVSVGPEIMFFTIFISIFPNH